MEARLGEALPFDERWEEAEAVYTRGLEAGPNDEARSILVFRRGNARDGAGRRPEELSDYGEVIGIDADDVLEDWAKELRRAPWPDAAPDGPHPARPGSPGGSSAREGASPALSPAGRVRDSRQPWFLALSSR